MNKNPASIVQQLYHFECPLCLQQYDEKGRFPMIICVAQHSVCLQCTQKVLFKDRSETICPQCRRDIHKDNRIRFRLLYQIRKTSEQLRVQGSNIKKIYFQANKQKEEAVESLKQEIQKNEWLMKQIQQKQTQIRTMRKEGQKEKQQVYSSLKDEKQKNKWLIKQKQDQIRVLKKQNEQFIELIILNKLEIADLRSKLDTIPNTNGFKLKNKDILNKTSESLDFENPQKQKKKKMRNIYSVNGISIKKELFSSFQWLNKGYSLQDIQCEDTIITAKRDMVGIFGKTSNKVYFSFSVRINKMKSNFWIGVVDEKLKGQRGIGGDKNLICLRNDGLYWTGEGYKSQNLKFQQNSIIKVRVDLEKSMIEWKINDKSRLKIEINRLRQMQIKWCPYIYLSKTELNTDNKMITLFLTQKMLINQFHLIVANGLLFFDKLILLLKFNDILF